MGARSVTLTLVLAVFCGLLVMESGGTNNSLDADGNIVWGDSPADKPYITTDYEVDDKGLDPYYALAVSYIGSSLPAEIPVVTIKQVLNGETGIGDVWQDLAGDFVGYALSIVIGFLFIIIFPIVGCCFCCCRCCGNCGGKMMQDPTPKDGCKRTVFGVILAILSLFIIAGASCAFVSSDQIHSNLGELNSSVSHAVDDVNTFLENIDNQFTQIGDTNFQFMSATLKNYVGNASVIMSEDIANKIKNSVSGFFTSLDTLATKSDETVVQVEELESQTTTLESQRDTTKAALQAITCPTTGCLDARITFLTNMDLTAIKDETATFKKQAETNVFEEMKSKMNAAIEQEVNDTTKDLNIDTQLEAIYEDNLKPMLDNIGDIRTSVRNDVSGYKTDVGDYTLEAEPYDKYRWYGGLGLACLLVLIGLLLLLGVALGTFCGSAKVKPTERSSASNCGGLLLMSAVGLIFIFGALWMLLTTLIYMLGAPMERYGCQSFDHLERLETYTDAFDVGINLKNQSFDLKGDTIFFSMSTLIYGCKEGKTLYKVLDLSAVVDDALSKIEDYKSDLSSVGTVDTESSADDIGKDVDLSGAINDLKATTTSIATLCNSIDTMSTTVTDERTAAENAYAGAGAHYNGMVTTLGDMQATCTGLKTKANEINTEATNLESNVMPETTKTLKNSTFMNATVSEATTGFTNKIFGFVDSYVADIRTKLANSVGVCTPLYSIANAIMAEAFCHGIVDPLNGFWLALGWCIFFCMPALILAVKLAKHYRRMNFEDSYAGPNQPEIKPSAPPSSHTLKESIFPPINGPNNKVGPF